MSPEVERHLQWIDVAANVCAREESNVVIGDHVGLETFSPWEVVLHLQRLRDETIRGCLEPLNFLCVGVFHDVGRCYLVADPGPPVGPNLRRPSIRERLTLRDWGRSSLSYTEVGIHLREAGSG